MKNPISDRSLAHRIGKHPSYINRVMRGERTPSTMTLIAIARELGVSVDDLIKKLGIKEK